jgi:hypothetical protein
MDLVNNVKAICNKRGLDRTRFIAECMRVDACSFDTAGRLYDGETGFRYSTLVRVAQLLKVSPVDLVTPKM